MAMKSLRLILTGAAVVLVATLLGIDVSAGQAGGAAQGSGDRAKFVGTYELITTELKDEATGKWSPTPNFNLMGTSSTPKRGTWPCT